MNDEEQNELAAECDEDEGPYCSCDLEPTIDESDWGVCDCCGKPLY